MDAATIARVFERFTQADPSTTVIALTAPALPEERQRCIEAGMNDFLAKPVRLSDLDGVLRRFSPSIVAES